MRYIQICFFYLLYIYITYSFDITKNIAVTGYIILKDNDVNN